MTNIEIWRTLCAALGRTEDVPDEAVSLDYMLSARRRFETVAPDYSWLAFAFRWSDMPEGNAYWDSLTRHLRDAGIVFDDEVAMRTAVREWRTSRL